MWEKEKSHCTLGKLLDTIWENYTKKIHSGQAILESSWQSGNTSSQFSQFYFFIFSEGASLSSLLFLVGGLEHFLFFHILGIIIPTDYFSEGLKPPTSSDFLLEDIFLGRFLAVGSIVRGFLQPPTLLVQTQSDSTIATHQKDRTITSHENDDRNIKSEIVSPTKRRWWIRFTFFFGFLQWMEEILHHLGWLKHVETL